MKLYFDTCCYGRPFDNRAHRVQDRVRQEITAIMDAIRVCNVSGFTIFGSATVIAEMDDIANDRKRVRVRNFYDRVISEELTDTADIIDRARDLNVLGLGLRDSYHVAFAEAAGVDYLLTTDDRFERTACRLDLKTKVINPINFFGEYAIWLLSSM